MLLNTLPSETWPRLLQAHLKRILDKSQHVFV